MRAVLTAFTFLTRLPVRGGDDDVGRAVGWFPLVGIVVGTVVGGAHVALSSVTEPLVAASVALALGALLTGGFHEDGLGDMADGFGGGWTREDRLEIMRDSRLGTYGVLAIAVTVMIRVAALSSLEGWQGVVLVATAHLLSRNWALLALGFARQVRPVGLGAISNHSTRRARTGLTAAAWFALAAVAVGPQRFALLGGLGLLGASATLALSYRKIGGVTGDVLGGLQQVTEAAGLVAATLSRPS